MGHFHKTNSIEKCIAACTSFKYAGVTDGYNCRCGPITGQDDPTEEELADSQDECNLPCDGNPDQTCGGDLKINIYDTSGKTSWITVELWKKTL